MKEKVLITGAGGYAGSLMTETFLKDGFHVIALDRFYFGDVLENLSSNPSLQIVRDDIRTFDSTLLKGVKYVIHLAAISNDPASEIDVKLTEAINHKAAVRTASLAKQAGVARFIFASSCSVYGASAGILNESSAVAPISSYAKTKIQAENEILSMASESFCPVSLRCATLYGVSKRRMRFDLLINIMTLHAWKNGKLFVTGGGQQWRPLLHLEDMISGFTHVLSFPEPQKLKGQVYNLGDSDQNFTVLQVANKLRNYFPGVSVDIVPDDPDPRNYHVSFDLIRTNIGFKCNKNIDDGIREVRAALEKGEVVDDIRTVTVKYYKYLIDAEKILDKVRINNRLLESPHEN